MNNILEETKFIMNKYNIRANKSLGQNFLIDMNVINKILEGSQITKDDLVIEIGPGLGTLTAFLLEKANKVICVELDKKMINILEDRFKFYDNLEIINNDILKVNLKELIKKEKKNSNIKNVKVVANLPYYITTPIVMKLLEEELEINSITIMVQKEVGERLIATPGERESGAITYTIYYYSSAEKILEVDKESFIPSPEVTSEVIKLNLRNTPPVNVNNKEKMFKIIKYAFMQRRKTLLNSLTNSHVFESKDEGKKVLNFLNLNINIRPEELSLQDFANISNYLEK